MLNERNRLRIKSDIESYFKVEGHSRIPMDYVEKWFLSNFKKPYPRRVINFKISHFEEMDKIASQVMGWGGKI